MNDAERERLAETRRLIFKNLANKVPLEKVKGAFRLSEREVMDHFRFVARAIKEYRFKRALTFQRLDSIRDAQEGRIVFFSTLEKIGPIRLTSDHRLSEIQTAAVKNDPATDRIIDDIAAKQGGRQQAV